MKTALACIFLAALAVNAHEEGGEGRFGGGAGPFGGGPGPFGGDGGFFGGEGGFFGGKGDGFGSFGGRCACATGRLNSCKGVVGSVVKGCPGTNKFLQCTDEVCANQTCPAGQVWNRTQNLCAACAQGMHVAANLQVCVCDEGTTMRNRSCAACPTDAVVEADRCYCNISKAFDMKTYACRACPVGSTLRYRQCVCNTTQFWNENTWACENCPGEWLPKQIRGRPRIAVTKCTCNGTNQIFDRENVKCIDCPAGTKPRDNSVCVCVNALQILNKQTNVCECIRGFMADAAGTGCVRIPRVSTTTAAPAGP